MLIWEQKNARRFSKMKISWRLTHLQDYKYLDDTCTDLG